MLRVERHPIHVDRGGSGEALLAGGFDLVAVGAQRLKVSALVAAAQMKRGNMINFRSCAEPPRGGAVSACRFLPQDCRAALCPSRTELPVKLAHISM